MLQKKWIYIYISRDWHLKGYKDILVAAVSLEGSALEGPESTSEYICSSKSLWNLVCWLSGISSPNKKFDLFLPLSPFCHLWCQCTKDPWIERYIWYRYIRRLWIWKRDGRLCIFGHLLSRTTRQQFWD